MKKEEENNKKKEKKIFKKLNTEKVEWRWSIFK